MKYRKKAVRIEAVQLKNSIQVLSRTGDGWATGRMGDWFVIHEDGRQVVMSDEEFRAEFEPDAAPAQAYPGLAGGRTFPGLTPPVMPSRPMFGDGPPIVYCTSTEK